MSCSSAKSWRSPCIALLPMLAKALKTASVDLFKAQKDRRQREKKLQAQQKKEQAKAQGRVKKEAELASAVQMQAAALRGPGGSFMYEAMTTGVEIKPFATAGEFTSSSQPEDFKAPIWIKDANALNDSLSLPTQCHVQGS